MTSSKYSKLKKVVLAAALLASMTGVARAQENSISRFGGEQSVYFNQPTSNAPADSAWRLSHPNGLTQSELQARVNGVWAQRAHEPVFSKVADDPAWRPSHPDGLSDRELQALSSEAPAWDLGRSGAMALASDNQSDVAQSPNKETFADYLARFFHAQAPERASTAEGDRR
jgi:hypothetical protein